MLTNQVDQSIVNDIKDCITSLNEKSLAKNYKHSITQCKNSLNKANKVGLPIMTLSKDDLYIVADDHHLMMIAKNELVHRNHLRILRKVQYQAEKYEQAERRNSSHMFDRMGIARSNPLDIKPKRKAAINYLKDGCKEVDEEFESGNFKRLTLIANPDVMNTIKQALSKKMERNTA